MFIAINPFSDSSLSNSTSWSFNKAFLDPSSPSIFEKYAKFNQIFSSEDSVIYTFILLKYSFKTLYSII